MALIFKSIFAASIAGVVPDPAPPPSPAKVAETAQPSRARANLPSLFSSDDYPKEALRKHEQGTVAVRLDVARDGTVSSCGVTQTSGSAAIDLVTCSILKERARFTPARDSRGQPTEDYTHTRIRWLLPVREPEKVDDFSRRQIYVIDADRKIAQCQSARESAPPKLVQCGPARVHFQTMIDATPPSFDLAGRQLIFEIAEFVGEAAELRPMGEGSGDFLIGRDQIRLTIDHSGMVIDCELLESVGKGNANRGEAICATERKRKFEALDLDVINRSARYLTKVTALYFHTA